MAEESIYEMELNELWNYIRTIEDDLNKDQKSNLKDIKEGYVYQVPIQYIVRGYYQEFPNTKRVKIVGYGKIPLLAFWEEIELREKELRKIAVDYNGGGEIITSRGGD